MRDTQKTIPDEVKNQKSSPEEGGFLDKKDKGKEPDIELFRAKVFSCLKNEEVLSRGPQKEMIIDIKRIKNFKPGQMIGQHKHFFKKYPQFGGTASREVLANSFHNIKVLSSEDWEKIKQGNKEIKPKLLLYEPQSPEDALNTQKIKKQDFYLAPWEIAKSGKTRDISQPTLSGEKTDFRESSIACLIYHPKYGRGRRDEEGVLQVWWPSKNEFRPISVDWFEKEMRVFIGDTKEKSESISSPKKFLPKNTPNLIEKNLLSPDDFEMKSTSQTAETYRVKKRVGERGFAMIGGINYYIGRQQKFWDSIIIKLAPDVGGVIYENSTTGEKEITHTFDLLAKDAPGLKIHSYSKKGQISYYADKKITNLQPYNQEKYYEKKPGENTTNFKIRIKSTEDVNYLLNFSNQLSEKAGINLSTLDFYDQAIISQAVRSIKEDPERVIEFAKKYGLNGMRSFFSLEFNQLSGEDIFKIGNNLSDQSNTVDHLFAKYTQVSDSAHEIAAEVTELYNEIFFEKNIDQSLIERAVNKEAADILFAVSNQLKNIEEKDKTKIVEEAIEVMEKKKEVQQKTLLEFKKIALELNKKYEEVMDKKLGERGEEFKYLDLSKFSSNAREIIKKEQEKHKKYDSARIKELIDTNERFYNLSEEAKRALKGEGMSDAQIEEMIESNKKEYEPQTQKLEKLLKFQQNFERKFEQIIYGQESAELPPNFETQIETDIDNYEPELATSEKLAYLPVGVSSQLPKKGEIHAKPIDALAYMFWLNNQQKPIELMVADTIQETNYQALYDLEPDEAREKASENGARDKAWYGAVKKVFGLNNIKLVNYKELENNDRTLKVRALLDRLEEESPVFKEAFSRLVEKSILEKSKEALDEKEEIKKQDLIKQYGKTEIAFILSKMGQKVGHEKEYRYDVLAKIIPIYEELKNHLEEIPELKQEKDQDQALINLSLYLAHYHNYPRSYYLTIDLFGINKDLGQVKKGKTEVSSLQEKQKLVRELKIKSSDLKNQISEFQKKFKEEEEKVKIIDKNIAKLGLTNKKPGNIMARWRKRGQKIIEELWFKKLEIPEFYYPKKITGRSFEMSDDEGEKEFMGFREFYSTYKSKEEGDLLLEANQVIASTHPMAAAKLIILNEKKQKEYFKGVLEPFLVNYYLATSRDKEEAKKRFRGDIEIYNPITISEVIDFLQRKIVWPVEMELERQK